MTARRSFFWIAIGQVFTFLVSFAGSVFVARLLTPAQVGTFVLGAAFVGVCTAATAFNIGAYIIGEKDLSNDVMDTAFTLNAILALMLSLVLFVGSQLATPLLGSTDAGRVMTVLIAQPIAGIITFRPMTMLHRNMQFQAVAVINTIGVVVGTVVTVVSAAAGQGFMSQAWGTLTLVAVNAAGFNMVGARHVSFSVGLKEWRAISSFGGRMMTISGAALGTARLSEIILGRLLGLQALGIYSRASALSNQLWDNVYGTATRVAFAQLSKDFRETGELKQSFLHSLSLISGIMCPILAGLATLAPYVIGVLYGEKWLGAALPFSILLVAQIVAIGFGMNWELFVIRRETGRQTRIELVRNVVALTAVTIGCTFSVAAASLGRLCDNLVGLVLYRNHVIRLSGAPSSAFAQIFWQTALLTLSASFPSFVLMTLYRWSPHVPHIDVLFAVVLGISSWVVLAMILKHPAYSEIKIVGKKLQSIY